MQVPQMSLQAKASQVREGNHVSRHFPNQIVQHPHAKYLMPLSTVTLSMGKTGAFANKIAGAFSIAIIHSIVHQMAMVPSRLQTTAVPNRDFQVEHLLFRVVKS